MTQIIMSTDLPGPGLAFPGWLGPGRPGDAQQIFLIRPWRGQHRVSGGAALWPSSSSDVSPAEWVRGTAKEWTATKINRTRHSDTLLKYTIILSTPVISHNPPGHHGRLLLPGPQARPHGQHILPLQSLQPVGAAGPVPGLQVSEDTHLVISRLYLRYAETEASVCEDSASAWRRSSVPLLDSWDAPHTRWAIICMSSHRGILQDYDAVFHDKSTVKLRKSAMYYGQLNLAWLLVVLWSVRICTLVPKVKEVSSCSKMLAVGSLVLKFY